MGAIRLDDLDKRVLAQVSDLIDSGVEPRVLDVGCGVGGLSVAMAKSGAVVIAIDIVDYEEEVGERAAKAELLPPAVTLIQSDIRDFVVATAEQYDIVVLQRVLHYLPYKEAKEVLTQLRQKANHLYLSVSGVDTAIARHYSELANDIRERWGYLDEVGQNLFSITAPLCLYSETEIIKLLEDAGWTVAWSRVSDFGNVKVVATTK